MAKRGIARPSPSVPNAPVFNSAEETTYESTQQGGPNCIIFPVPREQQTRESSSCSETQSHFANEACH